MPVADIKQTIEQYLQAYNSFDVEGMLARLHPDITFENYINGELTLSLKGMETFKKQAKQATQYFTQRNQKITHLTITNNSAEAFINYTAILATDLPNGMKAGEKLELTGKSVFTFEGDKIILLQDYS